MFAENVFNATTAVASGLIPLTEQCTLLILALQAKGWIVLIEQDREGTTRRSVRKIAFIRLPNTTVERRN